LATLAFVDLLDAVDKPSWQVAAQTAARIIDIAERRRGCPFLPRSIGLLWSFDMSYLRAALLVAISTSCVALANAAEVIQPAQQWPHWRGPNVDGASATAQPPLTWDATKNIAWKTPIDGRGSATPIVWGERVFVTTAIDTGRTADAKDLPLPDSSVGEKRTEAPNTWHQFVALALDRSTGKVLWRKVCAERVPHEGHHMTHSYAAGSPTTDGQRLIVSFGSFGLYCFDLDGKLLWERQLGRQETRLGWGEAVTPVLNNHRVYVNWDHEGNSFLIALDAADGKTLWKIDRDEPSSWATPLVIEHDGKTQIITSGTNQVRSYDAETGQVNWTHKGLTVNCIPSPLAHGDNVILMSGYRGAVAIAIPLDSRGDVTSKTIWKLDRGTPYVPSPVLADGRLYFTQTNVNILTCVDAQSGSVLIDRERLPGVANFYASPVAAAGRIYFTDRDGTTLVLKQSDRVEVLATNTLGEPVDASPALAGRQLFLRGEKHVWCIEEN
jgi:outer membrane protein assembly factor BamB